MAKKKLLLKRSAFRYCPEKYKIKRKFPFFSVNTKNISSHVLKVHVSSFSLVLRTRKNADIFNTFNELYVYVIHLKKVIFSIYFVEIFI